MHLFPLKYNTTQNTDAIKAGDVISVEDSFVHAIHIESKYLIPCDKCTNALYCGEDCLNKAQSGYHKYECGYHKYECDFPPVLQLPGVLFTRMTLKGLDELQNEAVDEAEGIYRSDSFKAALALETNEDKRDFVSLAKPAVIACIAYHSLRSSHEFNFKYNVDPRTIKEYLYKTYMIEAYNPFNIMKIRYDCNDIHSKRVGAAIYCFTSLFNHSCVPNCEFYQHGTLMAIRALATIPKGEQCCINYGKSFSTTDYRRRHQFLEKLYLFDCDCRACVNRWPVLSELPMGKKLPLSFQMKLSMNTFDKSEGNRKLLEELLVEALHLLKEMEKFEPCQNYLKLQDMLSEIYTYEGCADLEF